MSSFTAYHLLTEIRPLNWTPSLLILDYKDLISALGIWFLNTGLTGRPQQPPGIYMGAVDANSGPYPGMVIVVSNNSSPCLRMCFKHVSKVPLELFHGNSLRNSTRQYHDWAIGLKLTPSWKHSTQKLRQSQRQMVSLGKAWLNRNYLIMITAVIDVGSQGWYHLSLNCGILKARCNSVCKTWENIKPHCAF